LFLLLTLAYRKLYAKTVADFLLTIKLCIILKFIELMYLDHLTNQSKKTWVKLSVVRFPHKWYVWCQ